MINFNGNVDNVYWGGDASKVYYGSDLVWSKSSYVESYVMVKAGNVALPDEKLPINPIDDPISKFSNTSTTVDVYGHSYAKTAFTEFVFGTDYETTSTLPNNFLRGFSGCTKVNLSHILKNVTSIGNYFLYLTGVEVVDLTNIRPDVSIGTYFCPDLPGQIPNFTVNVGNVDWTNVVIDNITGSFRTGNTVVRTITASDISYGEIFRSRFGANTRNWNIVKL